MKKYVFLTPSVINMGGAQMYIFNKASWLIERGWAVNVFSALEGTVVIDGLKSLNTYVPELSFYCYLFSQRRRDTVLKTINSYIYDKKYDEVVIESTCIAQSTWGEILAKDCNVKHIVYLLQESNSLFHNLKNFYIFKHQRKELVGITRQSIKDMFSSFYSIEDKDAYYLPAWCTNVFADIDSPIIHKINWSDFDFRIGCLSRLDKPFIPIAIDDIYKCIQKYPEKRILIVMMGASPDGYSIEEQIRKKFRSTNNVKIFITGFLFPISTRLLERFDMFFTSAGSVKVCQRSGVPTISIDAIDGKPIGIYGRTTNSDLYRTSDEPPISFSKLFEDILINKIYQKEISTFRDVLPDFQDHIYFIDASSHTMQYFDFNNLKLDKVEQRIKIILFVFGAKLYLKLSDMVKYYYHKVFNI